MRATIIGYLALYALALPSTAAAGGKTTPTTLSEESLLCIECHAEQTAGIYQEWGRSKHYRGNVGCYECHMAEDDDVDAMIHHGETIATIVSPKDCARCHEKEVAEFESSHHSKGGRILGSLDNRLAEVVEGNRGMKTPGFPEGVSAAAVLLGATKRVELLTYVAVLPYHNPVNYAKAIATVDFLSGGRLCMGLACGYLRQEFQALSVPFEARGRMSDEYLLDCQPLYIHAENRLGLLHRFFGSSGKLDSTRLAPSTDEHLVARHVARLESIAGTAVVGIGLEARIVGTGHGYSQPMPFRKDHARGPEIDFHLVYLAGSDRLAAVHGQQPLDAIGALDAFARADLDAGGLDARHLLIDELVG